MTNKAIAKHFQALADVMELLGENPFKIKSYKNAYLTLKKLDTPLVEMQRSEIDGIKGVGKAIGDKIEELIGTGELQTLKKYQAQIPSGVVDMLDINGFGIKKIQAVWKELGIETIGELWYACNENRLIELNGFGEKTQAELRKNLEYYQNSQNKLLWAVAEPIMVQAVESLKKLNNTPHVQFVGDFRRLCPVVEKLEIVIAIENPILPENWNENIHLITCAETDFEATIFKHTGTNEFLAAWEKDFGHIGLNETEASVFEKANLSFVYPELRENGYFLKNPLPQLIEESDIKGVLHVHTTYSDGIHTLSEMANYAKSLHYEYIGITDHSKSAFYANGLKEERVFQQWAEIDALNAAFENFKIFKGIESDILADGSLDYPEELLKGFDFIIASVHSNLKMDKEKATERLIRAIENPYTTILGHPTGRLLLSRAGYPIDHTKVIDACAANGIAIELNANPYRLDLDYTHIPYCIEKGVKIAINPDAHNKIGISDILYGIKIARKGGLDAQNCLNNLSTTFFEKFIRQTVY